MRIFAMPKNLFGFISIGLLFLSGCAAAQSDLDENPGSTEQATVAQPAGENLATAIFAMGCFWCAEADFEKVEGVVDVVSGYTGGNVENPTYEQVTFAETGHFEAVLVTYDTTKLSYDDLLPVFWKNIDPFDARGQFCDKGTSYRAAIFPQSQEEIDAANRSKERWADVLGQEPVTQIINRSTFYNAEDYHQDYYKKNPFRYRLYRSGCKRDQRLNEVWGSISE